MLYVRGHLMNRSITAFLFAFALAGASASCVDTSSLVGNSDGSTTTPSTTTTATPTPTPTATSVTNWGFSGAASAVNLDGSRIKIMWNFALSSAVSSYRVYEVTAGSVLNTLGATASTVNSFVVTGLATGTMHTYVVQAYDNRGNTDGNLHSVMAMTFAGISGVSNLGNVEATLAFASGGVSVATQYNSYCSTGGGNMVAMTSVASSATNIALTGLSTYTTYVCKITAVSPLGIEDSNTATYTFTTRGYQGVILVTASGDAPTAPSPQPTARQVNITWSAFLDATGSSLYKLIRVQKGSTVDMTATTACAFGVTTSCLVCQPQGLGNKTCQDLNVDNTLQYDYLLSMAPLGTSLSSTAWLLPSADTSYRTSVQIPPANMVLVHRDSVNVEECWTMGLATDPLNHQRCSYSGLGAVPYSSGAGTNGALSPPLNLPTNYFDMGYNFFVDRFGEGCNWTHGTDCGGGDCIGNGAPGAGLGVNGDVYYDWGTVGSYRCYYKSGGAWTDLISFSQMTSTIATAAVTNAPGSSNTVHAIPPLYRTSQNNAWSICQSIVDPNYGPKRLLRAREFVASAAWPEVPGDPGQISDSVASTNESGASIENTHVCNGGSANGVTQLGGFESGDDLAEDDTKTVLIMGSATSAGCVSRYGAQDLIGNMFSFVSDQLAYCDQTTAACYGQASSLDQGNVDMGYFNFDGVQGPGGGGVNINGATAVNSLSNGVTSLSIPLGLPMVGNDNGNALTLGGSIFPLSKAHSMQNYRLTQIGVTGVRAAMYGGNYQSTASRYTSNWVVDPNTVGGTVRCALPAE